MTEKGAVEQGLCTIQVITAIADANDREDVLISVCRLRECYQNWKGLLGSFSMLLSLLSIGHIVIWLREGLALHFHNPPGCCILLDCD